MVRAYTLEGWRPCYEEIAGDGSGREEKTEDREDQGGKQMDCVKKESGGEAAKSAGCGRPNTIEKKKSNCNLS